MNTTLATVADIVNGVSPDVSFDASTDLDIALVDLGVDSLDNMTLFLEVQEKFGIAELPEEDIDSLTTVRLIVDYVDARMASAA